MSYLLAIIGLGVLIVVHELGHMLVARAFGMRVNKFSVGFGPTLARWRGRRTTYLVCLIPLGGYVQIAGMNPQEQLPPGDPGSYANKSTLARLATIAAGPLTNYLFAILIIFVVILLWGRPHWEQVVAEVGKGSPAERGGMRPRYAIEAIGGEAVTSVADVQRLVQHSGGAPLEVRVRRGQRPAQLTITPQKEDGAYRIGVAFGRALSFDPVSATEAVAWSLYFPVGESQKALSSLGQLFSGEASVKQVGGPLEIVRQLKMSFEDSLLMATLFLAMLNVYLGLFNLLPVPALDGGRLVFLLMSLATRRPVNQRVEQAIHTVGFFILMGLIALLTYRDALRFVSGP